MQQQADFMINADLITRQLQCAICLNEVKNPALTKCGHNFCYHCIDEVVNRYHKCPLCNGQLEQGQLFINKHLNSIKNIIDEERNKKLNQNIEEVFGNKLQSFGADVQIISQLFKGAISKMYQVYETQYLEAVEDFQNKNTKLNIQVNEQKQALLKDNKADELNTLQLNYNKQSLQMQDSFNKLKDYYVQSIKRNLDKLDFDQAQIDILVHIVIPTKGIQFTHQFHPQSKARSIKTVIEQYYQLDPVTKFSEDSQFIIGKVEEFQLIQDTILNKQTNQLQGSIKLHTLNTEMLLISLGMRQGSFIFYVGNLELQSDQPASCLTYQFDKDKGKVEDYFTCLTCNLHWICKSCSSYCHKGHNVQVYRLQFTATWAMCYCVSKGQCKAQNKNSK